MKLFDKISNIFFRLSIKKVSKKFNAKDNLFQFTFDENWVYIPKGNSYYLFTNEKDDLKGSLEFSIHWYVFPPDSMTDEDALVGLFHIEEKENSEYEKTIISEYDTLYYFRNYEDSNLDFHHWIIYFNKIVFKINYMIYEEESAEKKSYWLNRVKKILKTLKLNHQKFQTHDFR